jgi:hypothetical protein
LYLLNIVVTKLAGARCQGPKPRTWWQQKPLGSPHWGHPLLTHASPSLPPRCFNNCHTTYGNCRCSGRQGGKGHGSVEGV